MYKIGFIVKKWRIELGYTQEQLSEGICNPSTLSKYENGVLTPSRVTFSAIMERLGKTYNLSENFLDSFDFDYFELKSEVKSALSNNDFKRAERALEALEKLDYKEIPAVQYCGFSRTLIDAHKGQPPEVTLNRLQELIKLTVPEFNETKFSRYLLNTDELCIVNCIAIYYADTENKKKTIAILQSLVSYINLSPMNDDTKATFLPQLYFNLSKYLGLEERFSEALEVSEDVIRCCIKHNKLRSFADLIYNKGYIMAHLGNKDDAKKLMQQVAALADAMGNSTLFDHASKLINEKLE